MAIEATVSGSWWQCSEVDKGVDEGVWARECKVVEDEEIQQVMKAARLFPRRLPVELYSTARRLFRFRSPVIFQQRDHSFNWPRARHWNAREYVEVEGWQEESC